MLYYSNEELEHVMNMQINLPRYAGLARKALRYYLGDLYNPETFDADLEYRFRVYIKGYVELKVFDNIPYDWAFIDNFFRIALYEQGFTNITNENSAIDKGYHGIMRGELPDHHA